MRIGRHLLIGNHCLDTDLERGLRMIPILSTSF
jgi:hypothetical protein